MEEATFLTRFARSVTLIHRRDEFRASKIMLERAQANEKITFLTNTAVTEVEGDPKVTGVRLRDTVTGEESKLAVTGVFVADRPRPALGPGRAARSTSTTRATSQVRAAPPARRSTACSPAATSSTTPTGRPSPPRVAAVRPPSTPSAGSPTTMTWLPETA